MYVYQDTLADHLFHDLTAALAPLIARYGFTAGASFMSEVPETHEACREVVPHLRAILPGRYRWFRIVGLRASQQIVAHTDQPVVGIRYHLPIQLNKGCWVFHGGLWQQLSRGSVYTMDPTVEHGAVNWGETLRVHLLIDVELDNPV